MLSCTLIRFPKHLIIHKAGNYYEHINRISTFENRIHSLYRGGRSIPKRGYRAKLRKSTSNRTVSKFRDMFWTNLLHIRIQSTACLKNRIFYPKVFSIFKTIFVSSSLRAIAFLYKATRWKPSRSAMLLRTACHSSDDGGIFPIRRESPINDRHPTH